MDLCLIGGISPRLPRMEARVDWVEAVAAMEGAEKGAAVGEALVMAGLEMAKGEVMGAMGVKVRVVVGRAGGGAGGGATQWVPPGGVASVRVTAANAGAWRDGTLRLAPGEYRPACNPYGDCGHNSCAVLARPGLALVTDPAA